MHDADDNPFEKYGIDPTQGPAAITERMRDLAADAPDDASRDAIRAAWETLTKHPARRFEAATGAHPDSYQEAGSPPPRPPRARAERLELRLADLAMRPSLVDALGLGEVAQDALPDIAADDDPALQGR